MMLNRIYTRTHRNAEPDLSETLLYYLGHLPRFSKHVDVGVDGIFFQPTIRLVILASFRLRHTYARQ